MFASPHIVLPVFVSIGIIASKRCNNVEIYSNEVYDGGEFAAGIFLHRSSDNAKVYSKLLLQPVMLDVADTSTISVTMRHAF